MNFGQKLVGEAMFGLGLGIGTNQSPASFVPDLAAPTLIYDRVATQPLETVVVPWTPEERRLLNILGYRFEAAE